MDNLFQIGIEQMNQVERALDVNPNLAEVKAAVEELKRLLSERRKDTI